MYASSSACVGCSCVPSPALMTLHRTHWVTCWQAPDALCRITSASTAIASTVMAVSRRLSPLLVEEPLADRLMVSADIHLPAISNELRVRVESSKKKLMMVRPRRVGTFLTSRRWRSCIDAAVSRMSSTSARLRSAEEMRCFVIAPHPR